MNHPRDIDYNNVDGEDYGFYRAFISIQSRF